MRSHLDLGSGRFPRNPFGAEKVFGVDIVELENGTKDTEIRAADLNVEPLPFEDNSMESVSAFDFFEHILRVNIVEQKTCFPFLKLMSEIHRVLRPGGRLFALTPVYPKGSTFVDPTHVNFITKNTHKYFCAPDYWASMYGYEGEFEVSTARMVNFETTIKALSGRSNRRGLLLDQLIPVRKQHMLWDLRSKK